MRRSLLVFLFVAGVAGFFIFQKRQANPPADSDLEAVRQEILAEPQIKISNLDETEKLVFLGQFRDARDRVANSKFESLQDLSALATLKRSVGDLDGARVIWEYAVAIRPQNSLPFAELASLYHHDFQLYDKAEQNYLRALANDPSDISTIRNFFELYFYARKDYPRAEGLLTKALEDSPGAADLYALAGKFYADTGKASKALEFYEKYLNLNPQNAAVRKEVDQLRQLRR